MKFHRRSVSRAKEGHRSLENLAFLLDWYDTQFDEFVDSVYLDEEWIQGEAQITDLLASAGLVPEGSAAPIHVCVDPSTGEETCSLP